MIYNYNRNNQSIHQYVRQLMALPFLPAGHITETFHQLQARANSVQVTQLVDYVNRQWINNAIFRVEDWSVFRRSIRTNNDVEGWHHRLNSQAHHGAVPLLRAGTSPAQGSRDRIGTSACSLPTWNVSSVHQPPTHAWKNTGQSIRMVKCPLPPF
ncbi:hypothetical protein DPMN_029838 [Dreissena polymorpha]|uniref:Uncharacterized protein n=1 Tax=Dreissena polymorpha TaxID=45954 RepID=A0A9D4LZU1_DREPO|nr:hypothetical protein DPMN_029838 [Dreissena polymorpha]